MKLFQKKKPRKAVSELIGAQRECDMSFGLPPSVAPC